MATKLRAERIAKGALTIEQDEIRFRLDEHHHPIEIYFEQPNESHHLIEEFMLLANRTVATSVGSGRPFVYRVHDLPDYDKLEEIKKLKRQYKLVKYRCSHSFWPGYRALSSHDLCTTHDHRESSHHDSSLFL